MISETDFISPKWSKHKSIFITMETLESFDMTCEQRLKQGRAQVEALKSKIQLIRRLQGAKERQNDKEHAKELIRYMVDMKIRLLTKKEQIRSRIDLLKQKRSAKQIELVKLAAQVDNKSKLLSSLAHKKKKKNRSKSMYVQTHSQTNKHE